MSNNIKNVVANTLVNNKKLKIYEFDIFEEEILYMCDISGVIKKYKINGDKLDKLKSIKLSKTTLNTIVCNEEYVCCGGESGKLFILSHQLNLLHNLNLNEEICKVRIHN